MSDVTLDTWVMHDCTLGRLTCGDFRCFTLELPWRQNAQNISCIPAGDYPIDHFESPAHGHVLLLDNVPNRSMIEIHVGNYRRNTLGCILPGYGIKYLDNDGIPDVTNSGATMRALLDAFTGPGTIHIQRSIPT